MIPKLEELVTNLKTINTVITDADVYYDKHQHQNGGIDDRLINKLYIRLDGDNKGRMVSYGDLLDTVQYSCVLVLQLSEHYEINNVEQCRRLRNQLRQYKWIRVKSFSWDSDSIAKAESKAQTGEEVAPTKSMNLSRITFDIQVEEASNQCEGLCQPCADSV